MRIILTVHHYPDISSGAPGSTMRLADEYRNLGHEVQLISLADMPRMKEYFKPKLFPLWMYNYLKTVVSTTNPDVIDAHSADAWLWGRRRKTRGRRPLLVTRSTGLEHMNHEFSMEAKRRGDVKINPQYYLYNGGYRLWEVAESFRQADLSFLLNGEDRDYLVEKLGVNRHKTRVVPNGVSDDFLNLPVDFQTADQLKIAQVGSFTLRKGYPYSVAAYNKILKKYPQIRLSMLGTGEPEETVLGQFASEVRTQVRVIPRYDQSELPGLLQGHQIQVLASVLEGFGKVVVEGMACGLAPITTDTAGPVTIVTHEENGLVVPARDSDSIEAALERLITSPDMLANIRKAAYERAQQFSWSVVARQRLDYYSEFLQELKP